MDDFLSTDDINYSLRGKNKPLVDKLEGCSDYPQNYTKSNKSPISIIAVVSFLAQSGEKMQ